MKNWATEKLVPIIAISFAEGPAIRIGIGSFAQKMCAENAADQENNHCEEHFQGVSA